MTTRLMLILLCLFAMFGESQAASSTTGEQYVIKRGENLTQIARKFSIADYREIAKANNIADANFIIAGNTLVIPRKNTTASLPKTAKPEVQVEAKASPKERQSTASCNQSVTSQQVGVASWYGGTDGYHGKKTANGETYNMHAYTVAHPTLPFGTKVCITSTRNGHSVVARVNDRGPYKGKRIIDVSKTIARILDLIEPGTGVVRVSILETPARERSRNSLHAAVPTRKVTMATREGNVARISKLDSVDVHRRHEGSGSDSVATIYDSLNETLGPFSEIKRVLEEVIGPPYDVTALAVVIWKKKFGFNQKQEPQGQTFESVSDSLFAMNERVLPIQSHDYLTSLTSTIYPKE